MDNNQNRRPTDRGRSSVTRERPQTPASRPKPARPRTGNAVTREAARRERLSGQTQPARSERAVTREQPAKSERAAGQEEPARRERAVREQPARRAAPAGKRSAPARGGAGAGEERPAARRRKKPHRVYNTNFGFKFAILLSVVAVIVLSMIIFFKVKHIETALLGTDNEISEHGEAEESGDASEADPPLHYYSAEEIIDASGIKLDDNLLSLSKASVAAQIKQNLPYINKVQIKKQLPGTVVILYSEFDVTYAIQDERGGWWLMNREGRILEATDEKSAESHLIITGMPIQVPAVGDRFKPAATEGADMSEIANKQTVVLQLIPALEKSSFLKQLDRVDVSTSYDLTLWWSGERYEIRLGTTERLEYKLQYLQTILENGSIENKSGTVDLTFNEDNNAHFLPFP